MTTELFLKTLQHFQKRTSANCEHQVLLLIDWALVSFKYAEENRIKLLISPPHLTHKLQPFDVNIFGIFKNLTEIAMKDVNDESKSVIDLIAIARICTQPFLNAFTPVNILKAFKETEILPVNCQVFSNILLSTENGAQVTPVSGKSGIYAVNSLIYSNRIAIIEKYDTSSLPVRISENLNAPRTNSFNLLNLIQHLLPIKNIPVLKKKTGKSTSYCDV